jgi:hypothetical protein
LLEKLHISKRLLWAILVSLILHLLLASGWEIVLPEFNFSKQVIEAELAPPKKSMPAPVKRPPKKIAKKVVPRPNNALSNSSTNSQPAESAYVPAPMIGEDERPPYEEPKPLPSPKYVETEFEVKRTGLGSGKAQYRYDLVSDGRYRLQSEIQAVGLASLAFSGKRVETSIGRVTEYGLQPESYHYEISSKPEKYQYADFDWANRKVTLTTAKANETLDLPDETQDFLSFMYQFMFVAPLDRMQLTLTNGKALQTINYLFVSEEQVSTKLGLLNAVHIAKSSGDTEEKTELWLAADYRFIPIKILKIAKDGSGYELLVTRIDTDIGKE